MTQPEYYKIEAVVPNQLRISRHGISQTIGGRVIDETCWMHWQWNDISIAEAGMKELHPNCKINRVWKVK